MCVRLLLTDAAWAEMAPILAAIKSRAGGPPALSDRMFIEAASISPARGYPWRDLPADFGPWDAVYHRLRCWEAHGIWRKLWERLQTEDCHDALPLLIDATIAEEMVMHLRHATVHGYSRDCSSQRRGLYQIR
jgi:transposase